MSEKNEKVVIGRRDFFKKAGLGAGAVGAAAVGLAAEQTQAAETSRSGASGRGYQETAHVKKYYELARF